MSPKYCQGDRVVVLRDRSKHPEVYTVTRVMPVEPDGIRYRVKNELDPHERVLHEAELRPVLAEAPGVSAFTSGRRKTLTGA
jgi:hypothetical protein